MQMRQVKMMFAIDRLIINALSSKDSVDDQSLIGAHKIKQLFFTDFL